MTEYSEDSLVEQPAIALFSELGWQTADCFDEQFRSPVETQHRCVSDKPTPFLGRITSHEVILPTRLRPALERLNPDLPSEALHLAAEELARDRSLVSPAHANQQVYELLKDGVRVAYRDENGIEIVETVNFA
jgi:type I restriction enzyme, R subunit